MKEVYIAPNATVVGDVELHKHVNIWYGAALRGDHGKITVGEGTNIQDNAVITRLWKRLMFDLIQVIGRTGCRFNLLKNQVGKFVRCFRKRPRFIRSAKTGFFP